jgi:hypothetical protein
MTRQLSCSAFSLPHVLYATGTSLSVTPDSRVKLGIMVIFWVIRAANGLLELAWEEVESAGPSDPVVDAGKVILV